MANFLSQYQVIKKSCENLIVAVEDVNNLWTIVKEGFEARVPLRKACLNNKARSSVTVDSLPVDYVLTTDSRLRSQWPHEQSPFWFRQPYATIVLVSCEDLDEYKSVLKPRLRAITQNDDREWFIVFVSRAQFSTDQTGKLTRKIYNRIEVDFSSRRRERCCKLDIYVADAAVWEDVESKIVECIRYTLDRRVQFYEEEIRNLSENRFSQGWSFVNYFIIKESLAFMFEMAQMIEDALHEYDELEQCYLESGNLKQKEFGGSNVGDDCASILDSSRKSLSQMAQDESFKEFDFLQYVFARQASLLFNMNRPIEVAARGNAFIMSFSKVLAKNESSLPFCLKEVWAISACLSLAKTASEKFNSRYVTPDSEREFYRLQADLYSVARVKLMRLADLTGHGKHIERSPCNSAALSMLPWPKPAVWPSVPPNTTTITTEKEQATEERSVALGLSRKTLSLSPTMLLREANRRRASLYAGNMPGPLDSRMSFKESPSADNIASLGSPQKQVVSLLSRSQSVSEGINAAKMAIDRPMRLPEVQAAAEHALKKTITDQKLLEGVSSIEGFERMYIDLTRAAADNYHKSWRKRHGVVLDGEVASWHFKHGNFDSAAKLYEKVCALYAGDGWDALLAHILPYLAECQKQLGDLAGYLLSCVKLLSLDKGLLHEHERHTLQTEIVQIAHSALRDPVFLDVSNLITFSGKGGPPLELCEGDPGNLMVSIWSGLPGDISLDSLSMTLIAASAADDGVKVVKSLQPPVLKPGKNNISMVLLPQRAGMYILGVLTGQVGHIKLRSHAYSTNSAVSLKGGLAESEDLLNLEKPLRPVLQVSSERPLVEITSMVSWGLLMGQPQWLGLIITPLDYSLLGAILHMSPGPDLCLDGSQICEIELLNKESNGADSYTSEAVERRKLNGDHGREFLDMRSGKLVLPDWASFQTSVVWLCVKAIPGKPRPPCANHSQISSPVDHSEMAHHDEGNTNNIKAIDTKVSHIRTSLRPQLSQKQASMSRNSESIGVRRIDVKLEFGASHARVYNRSLAVQFLDPFQVIARVVSGGDNMVSFCQVTLLSQLNATITVVDTQLHLQQGYMHMGDAIGRPSPSTILPFVMAPGAESALLFKICLGTSIIGKGISSPEDNNLKPVEGKSVLSIHYTISGQRDVGAHSPSQHSTMGNGKQLVDGEVGKKASTTLIFETPLSLQAPALEPSVSIAMLPFPAETRVGDKLILQWRIERLRCGTGLSDTYDHTGALQKQDSEELVYEIEVNPETWMIAGRKKGCAILPPKVGSKVLISIACLALVAGYVRIPSLDLCKSDRAQIRCTPSGPYYLCVMPPILSSAYCSYQSS